MRVLLLSLLCFGLMACGTTMPQRSAKANLQTDLNDGLVGSSDTAYVPDRDPSAPDDTGFRAWAADFTQRAIARGSDPVITQRVMASVQFRPKIIDLDRKQPESQLTLQHYLDKTVSADRVAKGRARYGDYAAALQQVEQQTGVPGNIIVALWGKETSYGAVMGGYPIADALSTLAYDGRRRAMFEKELMAFLQVAQQVGRDPASLHGSWAGAMGQCQFMPTSYLKYAVDGDGDGIADIWMSQADVFASAANFLQRSGWHAGEPVLMRVAVPATINPDWIGRDKAPRPLGAWLAMGVSPGAPYAASVQALPARVYAPDGLNGPAYLIFSNFDVLMRWNSSGYFATGVGQLAMRISDQD